MTIVINIYFVIPMHFGFLDHQLNHLLTNLLRAIFQQKNNQIEQVLNYENNSNLIGIGFNHHGIPSSTKNIC